MKLSYESIQAFLYGEARAQAEKRWADWLAHYADDVDFFMPCWDDDDKLTTDPHTPGHYRPYVVRNVDAWYDAFKPKAGEKYVLSPEQRVHIW